jgi:hypothetical protein
MNPEGGEAGHGEEKKSEEGRQEEEGDQEGQAAVGMPSRAAHGGPGLSVRIADEGR